MFGAGLKNWRFFVLITSGTLVKLIGNHPSGLILKKLGIELGLVIEFCSERETTDRYQVLFGERLIWCMPSELYIVST